ncbi:putative ficolin-2 [Apostichopus japonicus]|uniref:Putative ficolin-2 n=1 Tax=Stichopus japonicus TaxID=307972 RepID=A0A2G8KAA3_STIJA|nr:putative ficolin-2 [Apostichopus japonicus]
MKITTSLLITLKSKPIYFLGRTRFVVFLLPTIELPERLQRSPEQCSSHNSTGVFMIKPDSYLEPFEVYCDNADSSGGWTVIQRRIDGSIDFSRDWDSYKSGFGFLSQEFWLGNERLSYLTNQKKYQLSVIRRYNTLPYNMVYRNCSNSCQRTCGAPEVCQDGVCNEAEACVCSDGYFMKGSDCVPQEQCGCYESEGQTVIPVFQRRVDGTEDFYLGWDSYKEGFGELDHEFWLGNDKLSNLTNQKRYEIRIDLVNRDGSPYYAKFDNFRINDESDKYRLSQLGTYSGTADSRSNPDGYGLRVYLNQQFTTKDSDNDVYSSNCAVYYHGAWWYKSCSYSLNGNYHAPR